MADDRGDQRSSEISTEARRRFLRQAAVGGGLVWTAPVLLAGAASAQTGSQPDPPGACCPPSVIAPTVVEQVQVDGQPYTRVTWYCISRASGCVDPCCPPMRDRVPTLVSSASPSAAIVTYTATGLICTAVQVPAGECATHTFSLAFTIGPADQCSQTGTFTDPDGPC